MPLLLLSKSNPLRWVSILFFCVMEMLYRYPHQIKIIRAKLSLWEIDSDYLFISLLFPSL